MNSSDWFWLFYKISTNKYLIVCEKEMRNGELWDLLEDGYEIVWDSAFTKESAKKYALEQIYSFLEWYQRDAPLDSLFLEEPKPLKLETIPISYKDACNFINKYHRHHWAPQGHKFSIGLSDQDKLVGVIMAGNPVARHMNDGRTLEITRCCIKSGVYKNAATQLFSSVYQVAKAMGYRKIITYSLEEESGVSLKACGFHLEAITEGGSWNSIGRARVDKAPTCPKKRWTKKIS